MGSSGLLLLLIVFMGGMLFFSSRQRKKQQQQQEQLQNSIGVGDVVRMTCGISGTVVDVDDEQTIDIEIAEDVVTTWLRAAVREKLTPDAETTAADGDDAPVAAPANGTAPGLAAAADAPAPPADAVGGTPTSGAERSESSGEVSGQRSS